VAQATQGRGEVCCTGACALRQLRRQIRQLRLLFEPFQGNLVNTQVEQAAIACTLGADDLKARLDRIAELGRQHLLSQRQDGLALRLLYAGEAGPALRDIVALERECCAFLKFELTERGKAVELTITAPNEVGEFAGVLFGHFAASAAAADAPRCSTGCGCRSSSSTARV
jgi:hypothetical protein